MPEGDVGSKRMGTKKEPKKQTRRTRKPPSCAATLEVREYTDPPTKAWNDLWSRIFREISAEFDGEQLHAASNEAGVRE